MAEVAVNPLKITRYLLCLDNGPEAAAKARFFKRFGFVEARPDLLIAALRQHAAENPICDLWSDEWGIHAEVDGPLRTPDGRDPMIRTSWIRDRDAGAVARLVTAFPR